MVATAVARAKAGLQEEHRPIASLLLYGPPGQLTQLTVVDVLQDV